MPAVFDAATAVTASSASSISTSHTSSGADRAVFVGGGASDGTPDLVNTGSPGTYGGVALVLRWNAVFATFYMHYGLTLVAPATGAQTVTVNFVGVNGSSWMAIVSASGVDQTTPFGTVPTPVMGNSASPSIVVNAATDDLVVDNLIYVGAGTATHGAGQTQRTATTGGELGHYTTTAPGAASVTMSHTITANNWAIGAVAFKAAAGAPAGFAPYADEPTPAAFRSARSFYAPSEDTFLAAWAATGGTIILVSDTGAGADTIAIAVGLAIADSGVGNDAGPALAAGLSVADAGAGSDAITLQVSVSVADAASGVDVVSVLTALLLTVTDAAAGSDAISIAAQTAVTDAGAGADQPSLAISLVVADSAAAVDAVSVLMATLKTVVDSGTGIDAVSVSVSVPVGDAGSGLDAVAIAALLSVIDVGAGVDIVVSFNAAVRIATITFSLAERSVSFSFKRRSISFEMR